VDYWMLCPLQLASASIHLIGGSIVSIVSKLIERKGESIGVELDIELPRGPSILKK
jgi:hypothetical protein